MNKDLTPEIESVLKHFVMIQDKPVNRQQLERQLKMDGSELSIILNIMVSRGYIRTIDKTGDDGLGVLLFSLTPAGKEKAESLS